MTRAVLIYKREGIYSNLTSRDRKAGGPTVNYLNMLALPAAAGVTTALSSFAVLRYLRVFGRGRPRAWTPLFALLHGAAVFLALVSTENFSQRIPVILLLLSAALALENHWLSDTSVGAALMLGSAALQNYLSVYFISCAVFRLLPADNYFLTTGAYRVFFLSLSNILCAAAACGLRRWFPNESLKVSLYSKSYSPMLRVWLPISNLLVVLCTALAMPRIPLRGLDRPIELAFFVILLGWMLANLSASYLIALLQSWRVQQNERAKHAGMTLRALRREFLLTYLVNISTDEFMNGRGLFHIDGHFYSAMRRQFITECVHPEDAEPLLEKLSRPGYYESMLVSSPCYDLELRFNRRRLMDLVVLPEDAVRRFSELDDRYVWLNVRCVVTQSVWGEFLLNVGLKDIDQAKREQFELQKDAKTQPLTGLMNRREWERQVQKRLAGGAAGMLAIIDLDHFKDVNDNLGHPAGDQILKETAGMLAGAFRADDLVGHIGGDEFCVFAGNLADRRVLDEKLRGLLARRRKTFVGKDGKQKSLSFSIGVALAPEHGGSLGELFPRADMALYQAKESGRDRYRVYEAEETAAPS